MATNPLNTPDVKTLNCPLMGEDIPRIICYDIHMTVDAGAPSYTAPEKAVSVKGYKEICLACKYHIHD